MFVRHVLGGWGSALETNNTLIHTNLSQAHKSFGIVGSDDAQDTIPFSAGIQNLVTQDNGSCKESEETYLCGNPLYRKESSKMGFSTNTPSHHLCVSGSC